MNNSQIHPLGTVPKSKRKIVERVKVDSPNTCMTAHYPGLVQVLQ